MSSIYVQLLIAIGIALVYGLANYFHTTPPEQFSWIVFLKTVLIGLVVGYVELAMNLTYDQALLFVTTNAVIMMLIDKIANAILSYFKFVPQPKNGHGNIPV